MGLNLNWKKIPLSNFGYQYTITYHNAIQVQLSTSLWLNLIYLITTPSWAILVILLFRAYSLPFHFARQSAYW